MAEVYAQTMTKEPVQTYSATEIDEKIDEVMTMIDLIGRVEDLEQSLVERTFTLANTGWALDETNGYYVQAVTIEGITSNDYPILDVVLSGNLENMKDQEENWAKVLTATTSENKITFIAESDLTRSLLVSMKGI